MYSAEGTGKTIEKAIESALFEIKAPREDVDITILSEGGLFKKAKVLVTISEDALPKYEKRKTVKVEEPAVEEKIETVKEEPKQETVEVKAEAKEEVKEEKHVKKSTKPKVEKHIDPVEFLTTLFTKAGKTVTVEVSEDESYRTYHVVGEDLGDMIGHKGEAFYAISKLLNAVVGKTDKKLLLDIGDYRERRKESLTQLALRTASKVVKSGRYVKLEPMNPGDRRIIHTALQTDERVTTLSKRTEPNRYVIVFPKEYNEK